MGVRADGAAQFVVSAMTSGAMVSDIAFSKYGACLPQRGAGDN